MHSSPWGRIVVPAETHRIRCQNVVGTQGPFASEYFDRLEASPYLKLLSIALRVRRVTHPHIRFGVHGNAAIEVGYHRYQCTRHIYRS